MLAAMLSVRVGSVCDVNSHSLGPVQLGPVTFGSARLAEIPGGRRHSTR